MHEVFFSLKKWSNKLWWQRLLCLWRNHCSNSRGHIDSKSLCWRVLSNKLHCKLSIKLLQINFYFMAPFSCWRPWGPTHLDSNVHYYFFNFSSSVRLMHCVHLNVWSRNIVSMCFVCDVFLPCLEVLYQFQGALGLSPSSLSMLTLILSWHLFVKLSLCL